MYDEKIVGDAIQPQIGEQPIISNRKDEIFQNPVERKVVNTQEIIQQIKTALDESTNKFINNRKSNMTTNEKNTDIKKYKAELVNKVNKLTNGREDINDDFKLKLIHNYIFQYNRTPTPKSKPGVVEGGKRRRSSRKSRKSRKRAGKKGCKKSRKH